MKKKKPIRHLKSVHQGKRDIGYFCPKCQANEVEVAFPTILDPTKTNDGATYRCQLCGASGAAEELIGALAPENEEFWTGERISNALIVAIAKHGVGPISQVLQMIGLIPRLPHEDNREEFASAQAIRDHVLREVVQSAVTAAFTAAADVTPKHYQRFHDPTQGGADRVFKFMAEDDNVG